MSNDNRGRSAHANGGATRVKKALFFGGSTPSLWASTKEMGSNRRTGQRPPPKVSAHTHKPKRKGGTPGEGSPLTPLLRSNNHKRVPPAAAGGQRLCLWTPPPLKRWTKLSNARVARSEGRKKSGAPERVPDSFIFSRGRRVRRSRRRAPAWSRSSGHRRGASSRSASRRRTAGSAAADARRRAGRSRAR